jgi:hypothetical protein
MKRILILVIFLTPLMIFGQGLFESSRQDKAEEAEALAFEINGYARGSAYVVAGNYDLSTTFGEFRLMGEFNKKRTYLLSDLRVRAGYELGEDFTRLQVKELFAGYAGEKLHVRLGNQIVTWGRTDGFNPTNNITPVDYFFLSADPDDQTLPNFMLRMKYRFNAAIELDVIGIPFYSPSVYRFDLFEMGEHVHFQDFSHPEKSFENGTCAARLNVELSKLGFSFSWFRGFDPYYGFDVKTINWSQGYPVVTNAGIPYLKNTLGADFSMPIGSWITRAELAFNKIDNPDTKMSIPNSNLSYVVGMERHFKGFNTILQYIGQYTMDFTDPTVPVLLDPADPIAQLTFANEQICYESLWFNRRIFYQQEATNHALAVTLSKSILYETLNAELSAYYNFTSEEYLLRPKLEWKISDGLSVMIGYSFMDGPEKSLFDYSRPIMSGGFIQLKTSF